MAGNSVTLFAYVFTALIGLAIGSFLNVVIWRVPRNESIVSPPSACPRCHTVLGPLDNIPVVSWLALRGRCRYCGVKISPRYPLVEAGTALAFIGVLIRLGVTWAVPAYCVFFAGLIALAFIDAEHHRLPKDFVWVHLLIVTVMLALASGAENAWTHFGYGALAGAVWFAIFAAIHFSSPRLLGFGDVRLSLVLGLALGWISIGTAVIGFFLANVIGLVVTLILMASKKVTKDQELPYGVYLAAGAAVAFYFGPILLKPFQH